MFTVSRTWDKEKKSESPTGLEPMTGNLDSFLHLSHTREMIKIIPFLIL